MPTTTAIDQLIRLDHQRAVVTGAAMGIGLATADRLLEAGATVVLADVAEEVAKDRAAELEQRHGRTALAMTLDVADEDQTTEVARRATAEMGGIDIWVNNAGIYPSVPFASMTTSEWDRVLEVNLRGTFLGAKAAAAAMIDQGTGGSIVNLTSIAGFRAPGPGLAHYVASKHAVGGLTKSLAVELGPAGIRVLAVAPTLIETPGIDANRAAFEAAGLGDMIDSYAQRLPLRRVGTADDVARVVLFAASDLAGFMTGSTLAVDGGDLAL